MQGRCRGGRLQAGRTPLWHGEAGGGGGGGGGGCARGSKETVCPKDTDLSWWGELQLGVLKLLAGGLEQEVPEPGLPHPDQPQEGGPGLLEGEVSLEVP